MNTLVYDFLIPQMTRSLRSLKLLLVKAQKQAQDRGFDENAFLSVRLAPDMFPFVRQVQIAADIAKASAAKLSGKTAPVFPDEEKTVAELILRVEKTIDYLSSFSAGDFKDYATQQITFPWKPGVYMTGDDYFISHAIPNFYFHMTTAYDLLRTNGVQLGKADYLGEQNYKKI